MFVAILFAVVVVLLVATAVMQRRTRRQLLGDDGRSAQHALGADAGATRDLAREQARHESHAVRHMGEGGH